MILPYLCGGRGYLLYAPPYTVNTNLNESIDENTLQQSLLALDDNGRLG